jgi:hypothetical protein
VDGPVDDLAVRYRATLLEMHALRVSGGKWAQPWNKLVNRLQSLQLELRKTVEGRAAITQLIDDENITVREWSAAYALVWEPTIAEAALEQIAVSEGIGSLEAKTTLREYRSGRLKMDWTPRGT